MAEEYLSRVQAKRSRRIVSAANRHRGLFECVEPDQVQTLEIAEWIDAVVVRS